MWYNVIIYTDCVGQSCLKYLYVHIGLFKKMRACAQPNTPKQINTVKLTPVSIFLFIFQHLSGILNRMEWKTDSASMNQHPVASSYRLIGPNVGFHFFLDAFFPCFTENMGFISFI